MDAFALYGWLKANDPELLAEIETRTQDGITDLLNEVTGLSMSGYGWDVCCAEWLAALKAQRELKPEAAPKKPPPALPVECWHSKAFDPDAAHAVTLSLCRGNN